MERNEEELFIVFEEHMLQRYSYLINKFKFKSYAVQGFGNIQIGTKPKDILKRIAYRRIFHREYKKVYAFIEEHIKQQAIAKLYCSNSEGFIAYNFLTKLRKDFPNLELIGLQHGVFELSPVPNFKLRRLLNSLFGLLMGMYPFGMGFGTKIVDSYIVYNQKYKDFLIIEQGWPEESVIVDLQFLKAELYDKKIDKPENETALFLSQCLSKASLCSKAEEQFLNEKVLAYLSVKYKKVLIKQHPACSGDIQFVLKENMRIIEDLVDAFNQSSFAYSFASTTLLEAEIFDIQTYAINSKLLSGDKSIYKLFKTTLNFEDSILI